MSTLWHMLATTWLTNFAIGLAIVAGATSDKLITAAAGILIGMLMAYLLLWNMGGF